MIDGTTWAKERRAATAEAIAACESPAEAALVLAMLAHWDDGMRALRPEHARSTFSPAKAAPAGYVFGDGSTWLLRVQHPVPLPNGRVARVDIALMRGKTLIAVEVDGHAFHHATDDQEARDATRDLALRYAGWHVVRVEAWKAMAEPLCAVEDVLCFLDQFQPETAEPSDEEKAARLDAAADAAERDGDTECAAINRAKADRMRRRALAKAAIDAFDAGLLAPAKLGMPG